MAGEAVIGEKRQDLAVKVGRLLGLRLELRSLNRATLSQTEEGHADYTGSRKQTWNVADACAHGCTCETSWEAVGRSFGGQYRASIIRCGHLPRSLAA